jgi:hypothetical protein
MTSYSEQLLESGDSSVAYRAQLRLGDNGDNEEGLRLLRLEIAGSQNVQRLLSRRLPDGTIRLGNEYHAYRKFQGTHWTLAGLAELGYPPGDRSLLPLVDQVHEWLWSTQHLSPPSTEVLAGQKDRVRWCASQEGLAIWYLHELGLADDRVDLFGFPAGRYAVARRGVELRQESRCTDLLCPGDAAPTPRSG